MKAATILTAILLIAMSSFGAIINVPADQPTIQAGINVANDFDTVLVAPGTYTGDGNRDIDFGGKAVYLKGGGYYGSDVIIQCGGADLDEHIGIWIHTGEDSNTVVDGFTVSGAYKLLSPMPGYFGAIHCDGTSPKIINCSVSDNAHHGIAVFNNGNPMITDCRVVRNLNGIRIGRVPMFSGASARISRTLVLDNDSCGIQLYDHGDHYIENCLIGNNAVDGIFKFVDMPKVLPDNPAGQDSYVSNTIVFSNGRYGLFNYWVGEMYVTCSDSWGNDSANYLGVQGAAGDAQGNLSADPLFCFPDTANYFIRDNSPCAPANNSCGGQIGPFEVKCSCCTGMTGNINLSTSDMPDLSDLSMLIHYLTVSPTITLPCRAEANVNSDAAIQVDLSDLSRLIYFLTIPVGLNFPPPCRSL